METLKEYPQDLIGKCFKVIDGVDCYEGNRVRKGEFIVIIGFERKIISYSGHEMDGIKLLTKNSSNFHFFNDEGYTLEKLLARLELVE
jgi:hypothetical protein